MQKFYLYENTEEMKSFISHCEKEIPPGMKKVISFYTVDPYIPRLPVGADLICVEQKTDYISDIHTIYDPFDREITKDCILILGWLEAVPYSSPLYVYKSENSVFISLKPLSPIPKGYEMPYFSPIYVLMDSNDAPQRIQGQVDWEKDFSRDANGVPQFQFKGYQGRCVPFPGGKSIQECIDIESVLTTKDLTLLHFIDRVYNDPNRHHPVSYVFYFLLVVLVLVFIFLTVRYYVTRNPKNNPNITRRAMFI